MNISKKAKKVYAFHIRGFNRMKVLGSVLRNRNKCHCMASIKEIIGAVASQQLKKLAQYRSLFNSRDYFGQVRLEYIHDLYGS